MANLSAHFFCRIISFTVLALMIGCGSTSSTTHVPTVDSSSTDIIAEDTDPISVPDPGSSISDSSNKNDVQPDDTATNKPDTPAPIDTGPPPPKVTLKNIFLSAGSWPICTNKGQNIVYPSGYSADKLAEDKAVLDVAIRRYDRDALTNEIAAQSACIVSNDALAGHSVVQHITDNVIAYKRTCLPSPSLNRYDYALMTASDGKSSIDDVFKDGGVNPVIKAWNGEICGLIDRSGSGALNCYVKSIGWQSTRNELYVASFDVFSKHLIYNTHDGSTHIIDNSGKAKAEATGLKGSHFRYHEPSDTFFALDKVSETQVQVVRFSSNKGTVVTVQPFNSPSDASVLAVTSDERVIYSVALENKRELRWRQAGYKEDTVISSDHADFALKQDILVFLDGSKSTCIQPLKQYNFETGQTTVVSPNTSQGITNNSWQRLGDTLYFAAPEEPGNPPDCAVKNVTIERYNLKDLEQSKLMQTQASWWRVTENETYWLGASVNENVANKLQPNGIASIWELTSPAQKLIERPSLVGEPRRCGDCWLLFHRDDNAAGKGINVSDWCPNAPTD